MSNNQNVLASLLKQPALTLSVALLSGFGLGYFFEKQRTKKVVTTEKPTEEAKIENYGELPSSFEVTKEELVQIMKEYTQLLSDRKCLEKIIPRAFHDEADLKALSANLTYAPGANDLHALTKALSEPIWDLLDRGGKRWRPILAILIAKAFERSEDEVLDVAAFVEIIHNGSLLIDDLEDKSLVRRDKPCVHLIYGDDIAVNAGCFMYYAPALKLLHVLEKKFDTEKVLRILKIYSEEMVNIHLGQGWDICWHGASKDVSKPTEAQYLQMTAHKTGVLARIAARVTSEVIGLPENVQKKFAAFAEKIGVAFQIQDDILNLVGEEYKATKGYHGEDIFEGKMTLIVIHSLSHGTPEQSERLFEILKMKTKEMELIDEAIGIMKATNSLTYSAARAEALIKEAWEGIRDFIPNNKFKGYLKQLAEYFINRKI